MKHHPQITRRQLITYGACCAAALTLPLSHAHAFDWKNYLNYQPHSGKALLKSLQGTATLNGKPLKPQDVLPDGASIEVAEGGMALIELPDQSVLQITGKAEVTLNINPDEGGIIELLSGAVMGVIRKKRKNPYLLKTTTATIGVKGTVFFRRVVPEQDYFCLCHGAVDYLDPQTHQTLQSVQAYHHQAQTLKSTDQGIEFQKAPLVHHNDQGIAAVLQQMQNPHDGSWLEL